jgi:hypothetical protein
MIHANDLFPVLVLHNLFAAITLKRFQEPHGRCYGCCLLLKMVNSGGKVAILRAVPAELGMIAPHHGQPYSVCWQPRPRGFNRCGLGYAILGSVYRNNPQVTLRQVVIVGRIAGPKNQPHDRFVVSSGKLSRHGPTQ